jgi:hypothetical protein
MPLRSKRAGGKTKGSKKTLAKLHQLLDYCASNPQAKVRFCESIMQLTIASDASYLSVSRARSRAAGYFYLSSRSNPVSNGAIHVVCHVLQEVVSSAAEAELAALFYNSKEACPLRIALEELDHLQSPTALITNNSTAAGIANSTVKQRCSKAVNMQYYWI